MSMSRSIRAASAAGRNVRHLTTVKNVLTAPNEAALRAWATANKAAAVRAVSPPPTHSAVLPRHLESLDAYLAARGWDVGAAPEARALASQALTYPLTTNISSSRSMSNADCQFSVPPYATYAVGYVTPATMFCDPRVQ